MISEIAERVWKVALVGAQPGVSRERAVEELVRLGENICDGFTARRFLKDVPKSVEVRSDNLEEFKKIFETQAFFHHQRWTTFGKKREIWVTLTEPDAGPDMYFALAQGLISNSPWDKALQGASIILKQGVVITFDRSP